MTRQRLRLRLQRRLRGSHAADSRAADSTAGQRVHWRLLSARRRGAMRRPTEPCTAGDEVRAWHLRRRHKRCPIAECPRQHLGWQATTGAVQCGNTTSKLLVRRQKWAGSWGNWQWRGRLQDWAGSWWIWQWGGLLYTLWPTRRCQGQHGRGTLWNSDASGAVGLFTGILCVIASASFASRRDSLGASLKDTTAVFGIVFREIQERIPYSDSRSWAEEVRTVNGIGVHV
mmetsp:Transcript_126098/g.251794  ORF Transcript_126098/g.251794 Transcript_126098/m.251794 type:complete len:229 (-) Transcript_126098:27-713(-)